MYSQKRDEQGTINLFQMDYLPILIDSFLVDRQAQGLVKRSSSIKGN